VIELIKSWYKGTPVDVSGFINPYFKRHWTAKLARLIVGFYLRYWQWLWGISITVILAVFLEKK
jgi:hypothetical protein